MVLIAGVDEVGRGCLAGPVYAGAVILPRGCRLPGLDDSKVLSAARREHLAPLIRERATAWSIGTASVEEIDRLNILRASLLAMRRAVEALAVPPGEVWVDGTYAPAVAMSVKTFVDGDARHRCIMAASVIAKVARDAEMTQLDAQFPGYGLAAHKGYGTREHLAALLRLGPCALHRRTFVPGVQMPLDLLAVPAAAGAAPP